MSWAGRDHRPAHSGSLLPGSWPGQCHRTARRNTGHSMKLTLGQQVRKARTVACWKVLTEQACSFIQKHAALGSYMHACMHDKSHFRLCRQCIMPQAVINDCRGSVLSSAPSHLNTLPKWCACINTSIAHALDISTSDAAVSAAQCAAVLAGLADVCCKGCRRRMHSNTLSMCHNQVTQPMHKYWIGICNEYWLPFILPSFSLQGTAENYGCRYNNLIASY